jgi:hypothetical protein
VRVHRLRRTTPNRNNGRQKWWSWAGGGPALTRRLRGPDQRFWARGRARPVVGDLMRRVQEFTASTESKVSGGSGHSAGVVNRPFG